MQLSKLVVFGVVGSLCALLTAGSGCASGPPSSVGFLSDYSKLEPDGSNLRFLDESAVSKYDKFIVDPVTVHFHEGAPKFFELHPAVARGLDARGRLEQ